MKDPRIAKYREAIKTLKLGRTDPDIPAEGEDELGQLGRELIDLSRTLEQRFSEVRQLAAVTEKLNAGILLDEVLGHVYTSFHAIIPYDRIGFSLLDKDNTVVRARWARSERATLELGTGYEARLEGSSLATILASGRPRIINDLEAYLAEHPASDSTRRVVAEGVRSSLTCPLIAEGKPIGFMFFSSNTKNAYENAHVMLYEQIAGQLARVVEKSRIYEQILELNEQKSGILGLVAHDLRNPIGIVSGYAKILRAGIHGPINAAQGEVLARVEQTCSTMLDLVGDLLDVAAIESGRLDLELAPVDLNELLSQVHADNRMLAKVKGIALDLELPSAPAQLVVDRQRIGQVLGNLLTNAVKFSPPGTTISLCARVLDRAVEISVADQGLGIPEADVPMMFAQFGKTSVRPTGDEHSHGLGLAIVKKIVELHAGRVWVESAVGKGSTFRFTVPLEGPSGA